MCAYKHYIFYFIVIPTLITIPWFNTTIAQSGHQTPTVSPGIFFNNTHSQTTDTTVVDSTSQPGTSKFDYYKNQLLNSLKENRDSDPIHDTVNKPAINNLSIYHDKIIRNISFRQLEVFGQTIEDTSVIPNRWSERMGNKLHTNTRQYVLKDRLLINSGDKLDAYALAENERLYRELPYIGEANVYVHEIGTDSVDITFVVKDVLPISGSIEIFDVLYGKASVSNKSIFGLGHEIYYHNSWNGSRDPFYGHKIRYRIPNISNTFFTADFSYEKQWNIEELRAILTRGFFSANTKYAGGIQYNKVNSLQTEVDPTLRDVEVDYNYYDLWLGRALKIPFLSSERMKTRVALTSRMNRYEFFKRPDDIVNESQRYTYHERDIYLIGLGIASYGYQKSKLIYGFGRTEDIPYGFSIGTSLGIEQSEFQDRPYYGMQYSMATKLTRWGYLYQELKMGTFSEKDELEQGFIICELDYISPLINRSGLYNFRMFSNFEYLAGFNRNNDEFLRFTNSDGVRGLNSLEFKGNQRFNMNLEGVCYSPHYVLGFRFVYFTFFDAGIISNEYKKLFDNQLYTGFGGGVRVRNENLVFNTVIFRLSYYPNIPIGASTETIRLTSTGRKSFNKIGIHGPAVLQYQNQ